MRALIVDDERLARARLAKLLAAHPDVEVTGEADSVSAAEIAVARHRPDVVFLDIEMPGGSGFELLARGRVDAHVVFVTAYDEHAVRAFEVGAVDYLLKPVAPDRLARTLERLRERVEPPADSIALRNRAAVRVFPVDSVIMVQADGDYCTFTLRDGEPVSHKGALSRWAQRLGPGFARIHRKTLVAIAAIDRVEPSDGSTRQLFLRGRAEPLTVSRSRWPELKKLLERT